MDSGWLKANACSTTWCSAATSSVEARRFVNRLIRIALHCVLKSIRSSSSAKRRPYHCSGNLCPFLQIKIQIV